MISWNITTISCRTYGSPRGVVSLGSRWAALPLTSCVVRPLLLDRLRFYGYSTTSLVEHIGGSLDPDPVGMRLERG